MRVQEGLCVLGAGYLICQDLVNCYFLLCFIVLTGCRSTLCCECGCCGDCGACTVVCVACVCTVRV